ncbi:MAG: hypothetical protein IPQ16_08125 [Geobacteraceae bacterium]|nr:hypothetical protein [Geobacteraceae bacterium]
MKHVTLFRILLPLLLIAVLMTGIAYAALLDEGPTVPAVIGSTPPTLGHGFPLWYRDTNRVPLQLCTNTAMCLFALPNPLQPARFPDNMPNEVFFHSADTSMPTPAGTADLITGVEGNILTETDGSLTLVSFARVRIRVDTNVAGTYVVTTPYKQYTFTNVPAGTRGINFTEDIGIGPNGHFAGALSGSIGPFLYCTDAPFPATDGTGGSYIGHNGTPCKVLGSTFPSTQNPSNFFRVQGPAGFGTVTTTDFLITGKLYTEVIPTPLKVDKVTYALDTAGMQVNAFATTQALSNQVNGALPFPANFALTGALSSLQLTGTGIPTQNMATSNPADGTFFSASGLFTTPGAIPADVTVTNTSDTPPVVKSVPLVDEVVIDQAAYDQATGKLSITASSFDRVANPDLQAYLPGMTNPLGTLSNGQLNVTFPVTDNSGPQPKTYSNPASTITVKSAKGGSATEPVVTFIPVQPEPATGLTVLPTAVSPQAAGTPITFVASATGGSVSYEYQFYLNDGSGYVLIQPYSSATSWTWTPSSAGNYDIFVEARSAGSAALRDTFASVNFYRITAPATSVSIDVNNPSPQAVGAPISFTANGNGGSGSYEYRFWLNVGGTYQVVQEYSTNNVWIWNPTIPGAYDVFVEVRTAGTSVNRDAFNTLLVYRITPVPAASVSLNANLTSPQATLTPVVFTAGASGGSGGYEYRFYINSGAGYALVQPYSTLNSWTFTPIIAGNYDVFVETRSIGSLVDREAFNSIVTYEIQ